MDIQNISIKYFNNRKEVNNMNNKPKSEELAQWKGSLNTANAVRQEIAKRWGSEEAKHYDPLKNCFTFKTWLAKGYHVKKGEKAIRSMTLVEKEDPNAEKGEVTEKRTYPKTVYLFYIKQVEK